LRRLRNSSDYKPLSLVEVDGEEQKIKFFKRRRRLYKDIEFKDIIAINVNPLKKEDYCLVEIYTRTAKIFKISMPEAHGQQLKTSVETVYGKPMPYETAMLVTISDVKEKLTT
jgi:hypothetical protein